MSLPKTIVERLRLCLAKVEHVALLLHGLPPLLLLLALLLSLGRVLLQPSENFRDRTRTGKEFGEANEKEG